MLSFKHLSFQEADGKILLSKIGKLENLESPFVEVQIAGENKISHMGNKLVSTSEGNRLTFVSSSIKDHTMVILQESPIIQAATSFTVYDDTNAIRVTTTVTNKTSEPIVLEAVSSFVLSGLGGLLRKERPETMCLTEFIQGHHAECQPRRRSFRELGLFAGANSQKRAGQVSIGNWSTKEALPMGIIEDSETGTFLMFQIESNHSWCFEISDWMKQYYLWLGGPSLAFGDWARMLQPGESYTAPAVSVTVGSDLNEVIGDITIYRRHIAGNFQIDTALPTIFNSYMHLCWDGPTEETVALYAPVVAKTGAEYFVIDCGWHNEEDCMTVHHYMGQWKESNVRFPSGLKNSMNLIRSLGMKPGLWIEPEVIGYKCKDMLTYYDDDCFLQRFGKPIVMHCRYFLDYRNPKVRQYMTESIRRMVEEYGAEYIKFDYNHDYGTGTDSHAFSLGAGLEDCAQAFLDWIREIAAMFPHVAFEGCASGGMRMDYKTLSCFSMVSTSDQTNYLQYPYIAGNILSAVLPEQAAVWSYPVSEDCADSDAVSDERIAINMINSLLGRMHLASHLERLDSRQMALVQEGIAYYNSLTPIKKVALPYFPLGFTGFGEEHVCAGLKHKNKLYLAVWCLGDNNQVVIPSPEQIRTVQIGYPSTSSAKITTTDEGLLVLFPESPSAVFLEVTIDPTT